MLETLSGRVRYYVKPERGRFYVKDSLGAHRPVASRDTASGALEVADDLNKDHRKYVRARSRSLSFRL